MKKVLIFLTVFVSERYNIQNTRKTKILNFLEKALTGMLIVRLIIKKRSGDCYEHSN